MEEIKTTKVCKDCGRELTLSEFSHHPKSKDGVNGICKECMTKKQKGRVLSPRKGKSVKELADEASRPTPLEEMTTKLIIDMAKDTRLSSFTDAELMNELKLRGYSGTITKQFTI